MSTPDPQHSPTTTDTADELLTPSETAEYLKVSVRTLDAWRNRRTGPAYCRIGRHVRYRRSAINAFLDDLENQTRITL